MSDAVVFAGGGIAGIAWELGVVAGLTESSSALASFLRADETRYVGTSAGSAVATLLASGLDADDLVAALLATPSERPSGQEGSSAGEPGAAALAGLGDPSLSEVDRLQRVGALGLAGVSEAGPEALVSLQAQLPPIPWPQRRLTITAVDAVSGDFATFDRGSGVGLLLAIAASCAVPDVWPPVAIAGRTYLDGGARTSANADLAAGSDRVLIITPSAQDSPEGVGGVSRAELDALAPARVAIVAADAASITAFGPDLLDPSTRPAAARAGRDVGRREASRAEDLLFGAA